MRATSENKEIAGLMGINIDKVIAVVFGIGSALGGAAGLLVGYWEIGLLMTGYGLVYTVMTITAGHLSDHFGRKIMLSISLGLSLAASIGYFLAGSMLILSISRIIEGWRTN